MNKITILLIEDNPNDVRLIKELLKEINNFNYILQTSETLKDGCEQIKNIKPDLVLLDLNLPDSLGYQTFISTMKYCSDIPIILVSGLEDEELSLNLIKEGAQDYITKQRLSNSLLDKVILYSIERKRTERALKKKSEELESLNSHFVGRELKMIELKEEVNGLLIRLGEKEKYPNVAQ
jgi:PleD family two-component response regulator